MPTHLSMVVDKYANIVSIGDDTVRDVRPRLLAVHVDAGAAEGGVGEVTMVDGGFAVGGDVDAVQPLSGKFGGVVGQTVVAFFCQPHNRDKNSPRDITPSN